MNLKIIDKKNRRLIKKLSGSFISLVIILALSSFVYADDGCVSCHSEVGSAFAVDLEVYNSSIHGREKIACSDCHLLIHGEDHSEGQGMLPVNCNECHDIENSHGGKNRGINSPACSDCHTKHNILEKANPESSINPANLENTCKICHAAEYGQVNFLSLFSSIRINTHQKQDFSMEYSDENCLGCHQGMAVHGDETFLNGYDCYKCHMAESGKMIGVFHQRNDAEKHPAVFSLALFNCIIFLLLFGCGIFSVNCIFIKKKKGDNSC